MNATEIRNLQAPLKEKYRSNSESAIVTLKTRGNLGDNISCKIETGRALSEAGLHPAAGGDGTYICSGDMLLEALTACAGVTLNAVAASMGIKLEKGIVEAEGDLDFRGTLGVSKDVPVGFKAIRLNFILDSNITQNQTEILSKLTERFCVVYQTLINGVKIETSYNKL